MRRTTMAAGLVLALTMVTGACGAGIEPRPTEAAGPATTAPAPRGGPDAVNRSLVRAGETYEPPPLPGAQSNEDTRTCPFPMI